MGILASLALLSVDGPVSAAARSWGTGLGGDLRRELEALQQFGALGSVLIVAACVWALDPPRRRRLLDLLAAAGLTWLVVFVLKILIGRPRPKFDDPGAILGPWGAYPLPDARPPGVYHAWDLSAPISSNLWSMPSSHTSAAVVLAVFLGVLYPRLAWLVGVLVVIVGSARVLLGAHYPSDVVFGGAVAFWIAHAAVTGWWGVRGLDWVWVRAVDRRARPAFDRMYTAPEGPAGGG